MFFDFKNSLMTLSTLLFLVGCGGGGGGSQSATQYDLAEYGYNSEVVNSPKVVVDRVRIVDFNGSSILGTNYYIFIDDNNGSNVINHYGSINNAPNISTIDAYRTVVANKTVAVKDEILYDTLKVFDYDDNTTEIDYRYVSIGDKVIKESSDVNDTTNCVLNKHYDSLGDKTAINTYFREDRFTGTEKIYTDVLEFKCNDTSMSNQEHYTYMVKNKGSMFYVGRDNALESYYRVTTSSLVLSK